VTKVKIIMPRGSLGAFPDEHPLETALRIIGVGFGNEGEWASKYGTDFENETFLMKPFCWCEKPDCPWCARCAAFEDSCVVCAIPHKPECYSNELERREKEAGIHYSQKYSLSYDQRMKIQDKIYKTLCKERGLSYPDGCAVHCDCGRNEEVERRRDSEGCDYRKGTGIFSRFAPLTHDKKLNYYDPPNFWFKPDNFRVTWYKYIGRDTAVNKVTPPSDLLERVFSTHPKGMTADQAFGKWLEAEENSAKMFAEILESLG